MKIFHSYRSHALYSCRNRTYDNFSSFLSHIITFVKYVSFTEKERGFIKKNDKLQCCTACVGTEVTHKLYILNSPSAILLCLCQN